MAECLRQAVPNRLASVRWRRHRVAECLRQAVPNRLASVRDHRRYLSTSCLCCSPVSVFHISSKLTNISPFIEYLITKLCSRSSLILSTLNSLQLFQTNLGHLNMKISQRLSIKACDGNHGSWRRKLTFYIFASMKLRDSAMKIHQKLDSVYGTSCSHDTVSTRPERPQRWATVWSIKGCHERGYHGAGEACCSSRPTYLITKNNCNPLPFTCTIQRIIHEELGMKTSACKVVGYPTSWEGCKKWREWDALNWCLSSLNRKGPTGWLMPSQEIKLWSAWVARPQNRQMWCRSMKPRTDQSSW